MFLSIRRRNLFVSLQRVGIKTFNIFVIIAMLMPNFASLGSVRAAEEPDNSYTPPPAIQQIPQQGANTYQPPVFQHPEPRTKKTSTVTLGMDLSPSSSSSFSEKSG